MKVAPKLEGDCTNLFATNLLNHFSNEMKRIFFATMENHPKVGEILLKVPDNTHLSAFIKFYDSMKKPCPSAGDIKAGRAWFSEMMRDFRKLLNELSPLPENNEVKQFMYDFIQAKYLDVNFMDDLAKLVEQYPGKTENGTLSEIYSLMDNDPALKKDGDVPDLFDAQNFGNIPFSLGKVQLDQNHEVKMIRMPCVTKDVSRCNLKDVDKVEIIEEFEFFLNALTANNKKHLYVNLMVRHVGNQKMRTEAIENLRHRHKDSLVVMTLDKDSNFYHQKGEFSSENCSASDFKRIFMDRLSDKNGDFLLPDSLTVECNEAILESVHDEIYQGKDVLSREERLNFIEHVYCNLIEKVAKDHHVSSMNTSCLNCIDRGQSQAFNFLSVMREKKKRIISDQELNAILLAPAVLVANRPPQERFFGRANLFRESLTVGSLLH